jgi:hypothetical protein
MNKLNWKRIYEKTKETDGFRIFVDRLWARRIKKEDAKIDYWAKEITPTKELRENYHKGRIDFETFAAGYLNELEKNPDFDKFLQKIKIELISRNVTMVFASRTPETSHIPILKKYLENKL